MSASTSSKEGFHFTIKRKPQGSFDSKSDDFQISVTIVDTEKAKDHKNDKMHVNYIIEVRTNLENLTWQVARRYQMFSSMDKQLRNLFGKDKIPPLPKKSVIRNFKAEYIEQKRAALETYLATLAQNSDVVGSDPFCSFLVGSFDDVFDHLLVQQRKLKEEAAKSKGANDEKTQVVTNLGKAQQMIGDLQKQVKQLEQENERMALTIKEKKLIENEAVQALEQKITAEQLLKAEVETSAKLKSELLASAKAFDAKITELQNQLKEAQKPQALGQVQPVIAPPAAASTDLQNEVKTLKAQKKVLVTEFKVVRQQLQDCVNLLAEQGLSLPASVLAGQNQGQAQSAPSQSQPVQSQPVAPAAIKALGS